ncbi:hypothetical protein GCM10017779_45750 [Streptomyces capillispiralis]|nr:hypothetical protein GCM10017779_45750 [Streptomyces capillispiralis]
MNSEVPMAKTARASRYRGKGIEWLRGGARHGTGVSSPRSVPPGALVRPLVRGGTAELRTQWFRGLTA